MKSNKYQEVEAKFRLYNKDEAVEHIEKLGFKHIKKDKQQCDTYYSPPGREFYSGEIISEWLRIREEGDVFSFNFKQWLPIGARIQNQCNEYETIISDAVAMKKILEALGFEIEIVVDKMRNSWLAEDIEISIDEVEGLGCFIELEAVSYVKTEELNVIEERFYKLLNKIEAKVGERNRVGYPYMLLKQGR